MNTPILNIILTGFVSLISFEIIWYWHKETKGTWKKWPAGRSLMGLLAIIGVAFGYGIINQLLGQYPARPFLGFVLYAAFVAALLVIRFTIRKELIAGRQRNEPTHTGPIDITVAEETETTHG
jgi:hypothetical protein